MYLLTQQVTNLANWDHFGLLVPHCIATDAVIVNIVLSKKRPRSQTFTSLMEQFHILAINRFSSFSIQLFENRIFKRHIYHKCAQTQYYIRDKYFLKVYFAMQQFLRFPFLRMEKLFFAFTWYEFHDSDLIIVSTVVVALFLEAKLNSESKTCFIQICKQRCIFAKKVYLTRII